ncbi:hypothetical protein CJ030_MR7G000894 [Morella rubra]|uniref:Protein kinase domain-containing protein n=1 Tax=Morella rubra TaxID=262757 RepID=A0A6A1V120_9ROSI|nr:hypothetical protein CJ030_MR7G000894 [Morella rubra]
MALKLLFLSYDDFSRDFPQSVPSLFRLYCLDLSYNNLSGEIPTAVNGLTHLLTFRLESCKSIKTDPTRPGSNEAIASPLIPGTKPTNVVASSPSSLPSSATPTKPPHNHHSGTSKLSPLALIAIIIGDVFVVVVVSLIIYCYFWRSYANKMREGKGLKLLETEKIVYSSSPYSAQTGFERGGMVFFEGVKQFELEDLLRASAEMLGKGGFGTAYKAVLDDGNVVGVKRLKDASLGGKKEFEQHMEVLGRLWHPNVVSLRAYFFAREEKLLVYDYMPNGSLFWLLHARKSFGVDDPYFQACSVPDTCGDGQSISYPFYIHRQPKTLLCSSLLEHPSEFYRGCYEEKETRSVLALSEGDPKLRNASQACRSAVVAPIESYGAYGDGIRGVLRRGFLLKWKATSCSICEQSGGFCGFNATTYNFRCLCPDGPHVWHCQPGINKKAVIIAIALSTGIGVLMVMIWCFRKKLSFNKISYFWKQESLTNQNLEAFFRNYGPLPIRRYSYSNIKKITNFFKDKLGQGGYGGVYKGKLSDGSLVAVKVLKESRGTGEEFINEVASISRTSHVNIVTLMGFCFEDSKRALIYEFMPNGSLDKFIYKKNLVNNEHKLEWKVLYNIAVGIARGLEYLHRGCNTRILHFDIKPHNILLDENFCPKISDFGLAKICSREESIISLLGARGTAGYIAPKIVCRNFGGVSHKSDVYSYGMMVLEMVGGRKNLDDEADRTSEIFFPHLIYNRLELDEELGLLGIMDEKDEENARKMIIVSLWCIQTNPSSRPSMSNVVDMLEGALDSLQILPKPFLSSPSSRSP